MDETTVVHCKKDRYDVYIGRPSMWGNPFRVGRDGSLQEVLDKYEDYVRNHPFLLSYLPDLEGLVLGCWCKPKPCHGDVLVKLIREKAWLKDDKTKKTEEIREK